MGLRLLLQQAAFAARSMAIDRELCSLLLRQLLGLTGVRDPQEFFLPLWGPGLTPDGEQYSSSSSCRAKILLFGKVGRVFRPAAAFFSVLSCRVLGAVLAHF